MSEDARRRSEKIVDQAEGKLNEAAGILSGDKTLEAEGRAEQRKAGRKTYLVRPQSDGKWRVEAEDAERASGVYETKDEATRKAKELAQSRQPSQVLVYKQDGTVQSEQTYG